MTRSHGPLNWTQLRALSAAASRPISTRGQAGRFKVETLQSLAALGLVTLSSRCTPYRPRIDDLAVIATITEAGRAALEALEAAKKPSKPRLSRRAALVLAAVLTGCGVEAEPVGMSDAAVQVELGSITAMPRRPCKPNMPDTCLKGRCIADAEGFVCVGTPWPQICKWHGCSVGDASTCETRPGTSGGICAAVEGPTRGCCLYPTPVGGSQW